MELERSEHRSDKMSSQKFYESMNITDLEASSVALSDPKDSSLGTTTQTKTILCEQDSRFEFGLV